MILEVCVESVSGALAAAAGGANRVELCADLYRGGTTPPPASQALCIENCGAEVVVLIRPRPGDFEYDWRELDEICLDLRLAREGGAAGVAVGALDKKGRVDRAALRRFMRAAGPLPLTFHRAFDWSTQPAADLEVLVEQGVRRVLTSGGAAQAALGHDKLKDLVQQSGERIEIVGAGGIRAANAAELVRHTGLQALHFTAFEPAPSAAHERALECPLSAAALPKDSERRKTSAALVRALRESI
ncbi:MAG: copper homeostasis protein CutC [bacterium]|jgi:copper homeostasis protein|nr:copper homeostasis protein CutC [Planctomycetota bacterium]HIL51717.1 copper homeostasis protein CutC [Planctomycetota bacterium]